MNETVISRYGVLVLIEQLLSISSSETNCDRSLTSTIELHVGLGSIVPTVVYQARETGVTGPYQRVSGRTEDADTRHLSPLTAGTIASTR